eukprot:scaffold189716_cov28-Tisochrysis_lutea.AAC.3
MLRDLWRRGRLHALGGGRALRGISGDCSLSCELCRCAAAASRPVASLRSAAGLCELEERHCGRLEVRVRVEGEAWIGEDFDSRGADGCRVGADGAERKEAVQLQPRERRVVLRVEGELADSARCRRRRHPLGAELAEKSVRHERAGAGEPRNIHGREEDRERVEQLRGSTSEREEHGAAANAPRRL